MADKKNYATSAGAARARKAMLATTGKKGRTTGYTEAKNLSGNRSAAAAKARKVDAATGSKKSGPRSLYGKMVPSTSVGGGKSKMPTKRQAKDARTLVGTAASLAAGGAAVKGAMAGAAGLRTAIGVRNATGLGKAVNTTKANLAKGLITKSEANKLILDANVKYNRAALAGKSPLVGISKVTANRLLGKKIPAMRGGK